jgi:hypothetical protein
MAMASGVHDGLRAPQPHQLEDTPVDKKAKTPKKPKTAKPKGTKTA